MFLLCNPYSESENLENVNYAMESGISVAMTTEVTIKSQRRNVLEQFSS
jgi:hypothetical protein